MTLISVLLNVTQSLIALSGPLPPRPTLTLWQNAATSGSDALVATVGPPIIITASQNPEENKISVAVHNHLLSKGTSIHFHGLHQHMTPWYDGVPGLSQNPISPGGSMLYDAFDAHPVGTHYYHSHTGMESASGLHGPLIIKHAPGSDPHKNLYDYDDNVLFFSDLNVRDDTLWLAGLVSGSFTSDEDPESDLPFQDTVFLLNGVELSGAVIEGFLPGPRYRLRIINAASNWALALTIATTQPMTVIASDGQSVEPKKVRTLVVSPGERYDVIVVFDRPGDVPLFVKTRNNHNVTGAVLRVQTDQALVTESDNSSSLASPSAAATNESLHLPMSNLRLDLSYSPRMLQAHSSTKKMPRSADRLLTLRLAGNMKEYTWTINGKSFVHFDRLSPMAIFPSSASFDIDSANHHGDASNSLIHVKLGEVVDIDIENPTMMQHPFHLHGHKFYLLGRDFNGSNDFRPVLKDSTNVPPKSSVRLRVLFDNPGPWLFHCHTSFHLARGMAVAFLVGSLADQPVPPENLIHQHSLMNSVLFPSPSGTAAPEEDASLGKSTDSRLEVSIVLLCSLLLGVVIAMLVCVLIIEKSGKIRYAKITDDEVSDSEVEVATSGAQECTSDDIGIEMPESGDAY